MVIDFKFKKIKPKFIISYGFFHAEINSRPLT